MIKKVLKSFIAILFLIVCFLPLRMNADNLNTVLPGSGTYDCSGSCSDEACKKYCGDYQVNDFMLLGVKISQMILGIVGALALLAFVAGGVMFLASAGNKTLVERGKNTIIGAVIGLLVVFASYTIISFTAKTLGVTEGNIFNSNWFNK